MRIALVGLMLLGCGSNGAHDGQAGSATASAATGSAGTRAGADTGTAAAGGAAAGNKAGAGSSTATQAGSAGATQTGTGAATQGGSAAAAQTGSAAAAGFQAVEAPPGGKILRVAVTPAGDAALTIDDADEVRLWPALDGTRAPLVVELPPARAIALTHAGKDFAVIAILDSAVVHIRLDARGHRQAVRELPVADGVAAVGTGFVIWRGPKLSWLDVDGAPVASLDAKSRVSGLVATGPDTAIATIGGGWRGIELRRPDAKPPELALGATVPRPAPPTIAGKDSDLVITTADGPRYLGYAYLAHREINFDDPAHYLVAGMPGHWLQIDINFNPVRPLVPPADTHATSIVWLAGDDWLVDGSAGLWVWTAGQPTATLMRPNAHLRQYNADSRLVLLAGNHLARFAPDRRALDDVAFTGWGEAETEPHLLSPSDAHGGVLLLTRFWRDDQGVEHGSARWIHDLAHPELGPTWNGVHAWPVSNSLDGQVVINDRSGKRVRWQQIEDGKPLDDRDDSFDTSPDGTRGFQTDYERRTISLADRARTVLWTVALPGTDPARDDTPYWLDATHAWMIGPHGAVAFDLAHGGFGRGATGWQLELGRAPHPPSMLGRPFATDVATGRDGPLVLPGDAAFQALVRDVAERSKTRVLWWGPVKLDGALHRAAMLQDPDSRGGALFATLIELAPDRTIAVTVTAVGFPHYQEPFPDSPPAWGTGLAEEPTPPPHTIDFTAIAVSSKWIHGSGETLAFTLERGKAVVVSDRWVEHENTGHGIDQSNGGDDFSTGRRPALATYKAHAMTFAISRPANTAEALAATIHALPIE